uniref:Sodium/potassium-transporting ATPase subunit alpha-4 n=1 Tax=Ascaris suum TaxID=6253 RepID=F1KSV6_ASCSU
MPGAAHWLARKIFGRNGRVNAADIRRNEESSRSLSNTFKEHQLTIAEIAQCYASSRINIDSPSSSKGLTTEEAETRLAKDGLNALAPPPEISNVKLFLRQFVNLFWILLIGAAILSLITYFLDTTVVINLYAAVVLILIVVVMCVVTFFEEKKAINVVRGFTNLLPTKCSVVRNGSQIIIDTEKIVLGDIVIIKCGSRVPADVRILCCSNLKLEASSITGEAEPIDFQSEAVAEHIDVFDAANVAFNGSFCVDGDGIGVAIRTGEKTILGQIASLTTTQTEEKSSLEIEINRFVKFVFISALTMGAVIFFIGCLMTRFDDILGLLTSGFLVVIIANVPQGLPATVTSELTIIARRLAKKNVYMKKLDVVDAFGAATVIASDKTGTLTTNNMTVTDVWVGLKYISGIPEVRHKTLHTLQNTTRNRPIAMGLDIYDKPIPELITLMSICNKAQIEITGTTVPTISNEQLSIAGRLRRNQENLLWHPNGRTKAVTTSDPETGNTLTGRPKYAHQTSVTSMKLPGERRIIGMPSEVALLRYADKVANVSWLRSRYQTVYEVPFNSLRKWHLMIVRESGRTADADGQISFTLMLKGAPEVVITKCSQIATADGEVPIDEEVGMDFQDAYDHYGNNGRRVIGFAKRDFRASPDTKFNVDEQNFPFAQLTFVGIAAIMDPPRPDTANAIAECKHAGIKVFMVTGDHPSTATAIAKEIGLIGHQEEVIHEKSRRRVAVNVPPDDLEEEATKDWAVVHGKILTEMNDAGWDQLLEHNYIVFARTTPEHKLLIVEKCQERGEIVCVTGDGVNDAPALKKANIGVAMGVTGSDVAKQAADVVLMDDNFASIVKGIEEGRLLFDNLRKTIAYTLTHTIPEVVPIILNFLLGIPMAITSLQILSIDLGTEITPAISLAYENAERDIMSKPPRKKTTRLVSFALLAYSYLFAAGIIIYWATAAYLYVYWYNGISFTDLFFSSQRYFKYNPVGNFTSNDNVYNEALQVDIRNQAASAYYLTLVMSQAFHIWMCTTRRTSFFRHGANNVVTVYAVIIETLLVIIFIYTPGIQFVMGASPPPYKAWFFSLGAGICLWIFNETRKYFIRNWPYNNIVRIFKW